MELWPMGTLYLNSWDFKVMGLFTLSDMLHIFDKLVFVVNAGLVFRNCPPVNDNLFTPSHTPNLHPFSVNR